ncbi:MAG: ATP-binding cassette domain-containing protein [Oscillospiraceae bacterium]|jgi:peptide/nickel transport system ATP-binding protein|nr:ATP-binding cassette domain-containing protein [Oscillospiraceae bacterium]
MSEKSPVLDVQNAQRHYIQKNIIGADGKRQRRQIVKAVDGVSFTLDRGGILGIIGESGCGKSTLGRLLVHLEEPTGGDIFICGQNTRSVREGRREARLQFRRRAQLIFQNPYQVFDPRDTIEKALLTPLTLHGIGETPKARHDLCLNTLERAGLHPAEDFLHRWPHELSGGQLQRIAILRAMMLKPAFLVADEAVSMLDVSIRADILHLLERQTLEGDACMVFISHDISTVRYISDHVAVMYLGRIVESGATDEVLHHPVHPYTRALLSNAATIDPTAQRNPIRIEGEPPSPIGTGPGCFFAPRCFMRGEKCLKAYPPMQDAGGGHCYSCFYS